MPFYGISVMENIFRELSMFDIHILKSVSIFFAKKLIEQDLLEIDSLNIEDCNHTIKIALKANVVICVSLNIINIDFLLDDYLWISHFSNQV